MNPFRIPKSTCPKCLCFQTMLLPDLCLSDARSPICVGKASAKPSGMISLTVAWKSWFLAWMMSVHYLFRVELANLVLAADVTPRCLLIKCLRGRSSCLPRASPPCPFRLLGQRGTQRWPKAWHELFRLGPSSGDQATHTPVRGLMKYSCTRRLSTK